ncbi:hypothetical protein A2954_00560 [Candidatus Roizmanbacteria bacterium RIFCSPLOWO2_01_FULL_37_12]|uniref:DNA-3-methyladenine glycosylase II n=1 Tax=Candidatus Roizmanbacteria bacterium RIFCSPLOWO2_01_FULL_37_12 TaxID=1802056 RepID=A0A1F7I9T4_9BACT|nr:MAG: hypothetical protein A3D76_00915 [Candidatus Roizmanbacteria bacterium RIFCSPHIGHO2_02_FULL_37_9b]OGK40117.1 MAG: hypothetical protein A2954_00560 [Candidatus Roizmanbacteria bacterium RIFCSPLOWO2_01_FULL_37_12]
MDKKAIEHFKKVDAILHSIIEKIESLEKWTKKHPNDYFVELCANIIGQQLSGKAADTIYTRFEKLFVGKKITPDKVLKIPDEKLRGVGMSWSKVKYVKDLAQKVNDKTLILDRLDKMSDIKVINELIKVKGIGPWTAEMFLMFTLGREDVFSHGDLGLRNAIKKLYKFKKEPTKTQIEKIVKKWSPYKTYASRILWRSLEIK